uniref:Uncharacterized protein n=1 Tax=Meloidogyne enterolobii TaxID=390850 RepID=A0A6V7UG65_MELEN|nr:unnamed protein product [Meloidogyne enterolobii]
MLFQIICPISLYLTSNCPIIWLFFPTPDYAVPLKCRHFWWHFSFHPALFF